MSDRFTAYITKYALTKGISKREVKETHFRTMVSIADTPAGSIIQYYHLPDWHRTREAAVAQAEKMRLAKIANLRKALARLEVLNFV